MRGDGFYESKEVYVVAGRAGGPLCMRRVALSERLPDCTGPEQRGRVYSGLLSPRQPPVVKLYDAVTLGDRTYVLLELGENLDLGRAILERSLTGRYRVAGLGYGGGSFRDEIVETDGRKYLLLGGRNTGEQITCATFTLDGTAYQTEIPRQSRFLVCTEVDSRTEASHLDLETLTWYNAQGKEVAVDYIRPISGR